MISISDESQTDSLNNELKNDLNNINDEDEKITKTNNEENEIDILKQENKELKEKLSNSESLSKEYLNKMKYLMADYDNFRKQMERQTAIKVDSFKSELLLKVLDLRDDFSRAIDVATTNSTNDTVLEGLKGVLKNFDSFLIGQGVSEIESMGKPFDANLHDAISFSFKDDLPENTVTKEIRKGYMLNGKLLRPVLVEISKKIATNKDNATRINKKEDES